MQMQLQSIDQLPSQITEDLLCSIFSIAEFDITKRYPTILFKSKFKRSAQFGNLTINYNSQNRSYNKLKRLLNMSCLKKN